MPQLIQLRAAKRKEADAEWLAKYPKVNGALTGWAAKATTEEKAMAYDLLVVGEKVEQRVALSALWIARQALRAEKPPIGGRVSASAPNCEEH